MTPVVILDWDLLQTSPVVRSNLWSHIDIRAFSSVSQSESKLFNTNGPRKAISIPQPKIHETVTRRCWIEKKQRTTLRHKVEDFHPGLFQAMISHPSLGYNRKTHPEPLKTDQWSASNCSMLVVKVGGVLSFGISHFKTYSHTLSDNTLTNTPWKLTYPLKNDGWKMYFLLK